jgi:dTDP-4-dehydrorhamnose 3,5-epimerase-like enzyme
MTDHHLPNIDDCRLLDFTKFSTQEGFVSVYENTPDFPFEVQRCFYMYDVPGGADRGGHAHKALQELIVAVSGSFAVTIFDGNRSREVVLNRPNKGLYLPGGIWKDILGFSSGAVCLVLASQTYSEDDYIRSRTDYINYVERLAASK